MGPPESRLWSLGRAGSGATRASAVGVSPRCRLSQEVESERPDPGAREVLWDPGVTGVTSGRSPRLLDL